MRTYYLRPTGPFSVAGGALSGALPRSDTLSAALVSMWRHVVHGADIDALAASPPFRVSSALPWTQQAGGRPDIYYPIPAGLLDPVAERRPEHRKRLKRVAYATAAAIRGALWAQDFDFEQNACPGGVLLSHRPAGAKGRPEPFVDAGRRLRVAVDRLGDGPLDGLLFDEDAAHFAPDCGFAVMADVEAAAVGAFESALRLLGLEGLGSERTTGHGGFHVEHVELDAVPDFGRGRRLLVSLYHPTREEVTAGVLDDGASYTLIERSGWITVPAVRPLRRRPVRMLAEGSVIRDVPGIPLGDVVLALPPQPELGLHFPVYRDGRALSLSFPAAEARHA